MPSLSLKETYQNWWDKAPRITTETIERGTLDELFAHVFRHYFNRSKYNNSVCYQILEDDMREAYYEWVDDVNNYANNGGDMW